MEKKQRGFVKGQAKMGGRQKGTPNKMPTVLKEITMDSLQLKGIRLVEELDYEIGELERLQERLKKAKDIKDADKRKAARQARRRKVKQQEAIVRKMFQYRDGGPTAALLWIQNNETAAYVALLARLLPYQITGKVEHDMQRFYETPEEVAARLKEMGLPIPPPLIDVTPTKSITHR